MKDITAILEEIEECADHHLGIKVKNVEYGYNAQDMTEALLRKVFDLLSTHAVIDNQAARYLNDYYQQDSQTFGLDEKDKEGWSHVKAELTRLTDSEWRK